MTTKSTFGASVSESDEKLAQDRKNRPEIGAIWRNSSKTNTEFMTIKLNMPKSKLLSLIENSKLDDNGNVLVSLIAFPNISHNGNNKRPVFRIFEELDRSNR